MYTHNLDPILFEIGYVSIRWYSLAYVFGILIGWWYGKKILLYKFKILNTNLNSEKFDDLITSIIISIIIGGRLGYVLFYNLSTTFTILLRCLKFGRAGCLFMVH